MRIAFRVATLAALLLTVVTVASAHAQDRSKTKEVVVGLGAEPRTMLAATIVDWTTNNMLEHIYDRLLDRDPKTFKPVPIGFSASLAGPSSLSALAGSMSEFVSDALSTRFGHGCFVTNRTV